MHRTEFSGRISFHYKHKEPTRIRTKGKLIGQIEQNVENALSLFTTTEDHETSANHIVKAIHSFINSKSSKGPIPSKFFVRLDNCGQDNKNKFLMAYMESLVALGVFKLVKVGSLSKGHTHKDIDQAFTQTSTRLRFNEAVTPMYLHA